MKKYAFCSKIPGVTRIRKGEPASNVLTSRRGVCLVADIFRKSMKKFKILKRCPLIVSTQGDTMINNMVLSREIEWIGYEHKRNMLQVEFIVGSIYQYENVPETVYQEFLTAPSHGRFFESNIKNKYQVRKVR